MKPLLCLVWPHYCVESFRFPCRLGDKVKVNWKLTAIKKLTDGGYTLTYETPEGTKTVGARSLVLTVPSYVAKDILRPLSVGNIPFLYFVENRAKNDKTLRILNTSK